MCWRRHLLLGEPALDWCQLHLAANGLLLCLHFRFSSRYRRQFCHGLVLKHLLGRQVQSGLPGPRDDLDAQYRIAAQFEEVVMNADIRGSQHPPEDRGQLSLRFTARRFPIA
ncbi:hypothetical protein D3C75_651000 [compost metagenome]